jgi:uncharacterized lipoprotein YajG
MKFLSICLSAVAVTLCAGCAQQPRTSEMGAGPATAARTVNCRDGAWVTPAVGCADHYGTERVMSAPSAQ